VDPYGSAGKYYFALGADELPLAAAKPVGTRIVFSPEVVRFGQTIAPRKCAGGTIGVAGLAAGDIAGDGDLDMCITGTGEKGQTAVWINDGKEHLRRGDAYNRGSGRASGMWTTTATWTCGWEGSGARVF
jgi:hypothetical protein